MGDIGDHPKRDLALMATSHGKTLTTVTEAGKRVVAPCNCKEEKPSLKISFEIPTGDERRGLTRVQKLWKSHKACSSTNLLTIFNL